jgi:peptidoglycan-associated lipoprotein
MKKNTWLVVLALVCTVSLTGCPKKPAVNPDAGLTSSGAGPEPSTPSENIEDSDHGNAMGLQTIHFPYDSFEIVGENKDVLKGDIKILRDNPTLKVQIEGHCDERGGVQYNLALGEKRANAVKKQFQAGGVAASRLTIISMGKEKPVDPGHDEAAWAKNRRANFAVTAK